MTGYQAIASRLARSASERLGASFVSCYLMGSGAKGEERVGTSDIDILIVVRGNRVVHQWNRFPPSFSFLEEFAEEASGLAQEAVSPRPPFRLRFLVTTVVGEERLRREADGMLYFDIQGAKLLAGREVRKRLRKPSWGTLDAELTRDIDRWRKRMVTNVLTLDIRRQPHRLASYAAMYSLPTAGAYIALKRRKIITNKKDIPRVFLREFPEFESAGVLRDVLDEYLHWRSRDENLERVSSLWFRSLRFLVEVQHKAGIGR